MPTTIVVDPIFIRKFLIFTTRRNPLWIEICSTIRSVMARRFPPKGKSLAELYPEIAAEWHPDNELKPTEVFSKSHTYVMWICSVCDDHYRARIANRTAINMGCAACVGQKVHRDGRNSFAKKFPHLVKEWHPENEFGPHEITSGSNKKVK